MHWQHLGLRLQNFARSFEWFENLEQKMLQNREMEHYGSALQPSTKPNPTMSRSWVPLKILGGVAAVFVMTNLVLSRRMQREKEKQYLRNKLDKLEMSTHKKKDGFWQLLNTPCLGSPIDNLSFGRSSGADRPGCSIVHAKQKSVVLSKHAIVNSTSSQDQLQNMLHGIDSAWSAQDDKVEFTIDVQRSAHVTDMKFQWSGSDWPEFMSVWGSPDGQAWSQMHKIHNLGDRSDSCKLWALEGDCVNNPKYMLQACQRSCYNVASKAAAVSYTMSANTCLRNIDGLGQYNELASAVECKALCSLKAECFGVSYSSTYHNGRSTCFLAAVGDSPKAQSPCQSKSSWTTFTKSHIDIHPLQAHPLEDPLVHDGTDNMKLVNPSSDGWLELPGWEEDTRFVRVGLSHSKEHWRSMKFGIRKLEINGIAPWERCAGPEGLCTCVGSARMWRKDKKSWISKGATGSFICTPKSFKLSNRAVGGECQCWPSASEDEALNLCRSQCDSLGSRCDAFEYSFVTDIRRDALGPQCCFRSKPQRSEETMAETASDCYQKVTVPIVPT